MKRLPGLTITELRDGDLKKETQSILASIKPYESLIALTEEGEGLSSIAFSKRLQKLAPSRLAFVIGGANGLTCEIKAMANFCLSLSPLTFPHEIARLLLAEQIYRASTISQGSPYHRE